MIPATFPSKMDTILKKDSCIVYFLTSISGLVRWVDYIPVKLVSTSTTKEATCNVSGYQPITALANITNKVRWLDYIPVYIDTSATVPFSTNANGYIPIGLPYNSITKIFEAGGYNGAIYSADEPCFLNQLSTGATPVIAVTNPVGLVLDSSLGLVLGSELVTNGTFDTATTGWSVTAGNGTIAAVGGELQVTSGTGGVLASTPITTVVGKTYKMYVTGRRGTYTGTPQFGFGATSGATPAELTFATTSNETKTAVYTATTTTTYIIARFPTIENGATSYFDNVSVKLLTGNHAIQATAAARPTWQVDAGGKNYLSFLGTDDRLSSVTGGGGSAGIFWCGAVQCTGGNETERPLFADIVTNQGYAIRISAVNQLTIHAGNGTAYTSRTGVSSISIGTKYLLTVWDDGVNLNAQVNNGTVYTTPRPVVVAGTNDFVIGNDSSGGYFIGYMYPSVYVKGSGLTAAQRAAIQAWVKSKAGLL